MLLASPLQRLTAFFAGLTLEVRAVIAASRGCDSNTKGACNRPLRTAGTRQLSQPESTTTEHSPAETHDHQHTPEPRPLGECEREISVEIPAETVSGKVESFVVRYQKMARVPGFRRGKTPASLIRRRFADELRQEVVESLIPKFFREEVQKRGLTPISQPRITDFHFEDGDPLRFKAVFEIMPEIEVAPYTDLKAEKKDIAVSEEEVEKELQALRENQASYTSIDEEIGRAHV